MKLQQGDVIIKKIDYGVKGDELNHLILAEGEATGHCHQISSGIAKLIVMDKLLHLQVFSETARLRHEEHNEIIIPKGDYVIGIVREYDHFSEETREVSD